MVNTIHQLAGGEIQYRLAQTTGHGAVPRMPSASAEATKTASPPMKTRSPSWPVTNSRDILNYRTWRNSNRPMSDALPSW